MKKVYEAPDMEIELFRFADIITLSGDIDDSGIGSGDGVVDPWEN